ncbi:hypothetical protein FNV43_RR20337 [Rhamnella rubrinervis]|uniref:RNase H type-1 domain-containing protein n=1 Tax=Rhamnella rubrinervis TaxID=2594499 RepID=A0A8K0DZI3_9ROSA|nr:hypothetical protein FNV43_RR20337 [Rhamnella rubrinervis]
MKLFIVERGIWCTLHRCFVKELQTLSQGKWCPAPLNWLKANIDAAFKDGIAALAFVLRDENGRVVFLASKLDCAPDAMEAELKALVWPLRQQERKLGSKCYGFQMLKPLLEMRFRPLSRVVGISVADATAKFTQRVAHELARHALLVEDFVFLEKGPMWLLPTILDDVSLIT